MTAVPVPAVVETVVVTVEIQVVRLPGVSDAHLLDATLGQIEGMARLRPGTTVSAYAEPEARRDWSCAGSVVAVGFAAEITPASSTLEVAQ